MKFNSWLKVGPLLGLSIYLFGFLEPKHSTLETNMEKAVSATKSDATQLIFKFKIIPNEGMKLADSQGENKAPWKLTIKPAKSINRKPNGQKGSFQISTPTLSSKDQVDSFHLESGTFTVKSGLNPDKDGELEYKIRAFICTEADEGQCFPELHKGKISWKGSVLQKP